MFLYSAAHLNITYFKNDTEDLHFNNTSTFFNRNQNRYLLSELNSYTVSVNFKHSFILFLASIISSSMVLHKLNSLITRLRPHIRVQKPLAYYTFYCPPRLSTHTLNLGWLASFFSDFILFWVKELRYSNATLAILIFAPAKK